MVADGSLTGQICSFGLPRVFTIISRVARSVLAGNRGSCCSSSAMMQPTDHMSMASVYVSKPNRISGALQQTSNFTRSAHMPLQDQHTCTCQRTSTHAVMRRAKNARHPTCSVCGHPVIRGDLCKSLRRCLQASMHARCK